jgi:exonuclease III
MGKKRNPHIISGTGKDRCFHIDYTFVLDSRASQLKDVTIGRYEDWRATSDHVPVVVDVAEV